MAEDERLCNRQCSEYQDAWCPGTDGDCIGEPDEEIRLGDVRRMNVKPGDKILITLPAWDIPAVAKEERMRAILMGFKDAFPDNKVIIVINGVEVSVVEGGEG